MAAGPTRTISVGDVALSRALHIPPRRPVQNRSFTRDPGPLNGESPYPISGMGTQTGRYNHKSDSYTTPDGQQNEAMPRDPNTPHQGWYTYISCAGIALSQSTG